MKKIVCLFLIIGFLATNAWSLELTCSGLDANLGSIKFTQKLTGDKISGYDVKYVYVNGEEQLYYETDSEFIIFYIGGVGLKYETIINRIDGTYIQTGKRLFSSETQLIYRGKCSKPSEKKF